MANAPAPPTDPPVAPAAAAPAEITPPPPTSVSGAFTPRS
jgi:hypothetical protein